VRGRACVLCDATGRFSAVKYLLIYDSHLLHRKACPYQCLGSPDNSWPSSCLGLGRTDIVIKSNVLLPRL
jgi:hypothetical protein